MARATNFVARKRKYVSDTSTGSEPYAKRSKTLQAGLGKFGKNARFIKDNVASSEKRRLKRIDDRNVDTVCFACRENGHTARECPNATSLGEGTSTVGICYRCGSSYHTLSRCRKSTNPTNPLPFASCFVCNQKGHLAGSCPSNSRGLYPNGGGCKVCGENDHLAKDCPTRKAGNEPQKHLIGIIEPSSSSQQPEIDLTMGADEDDFHVLRRRTAAVSKEEQREDRLAKLAKKTRHALNLGSNEPNSLLGTPSTVTYPVPFDDPLDPEKSSYPASGVHPSRTALIVSADDVNPHTSSSEPHVQPPKMKSSKKSKSKTRPEMEPEVQEHRKQTANEEREENERKQQERMAAIGAALPAFIARGGATSGASRAMGAPKTKVVKF